MFETSEKTGPSQQGHTTVEVFESEGHAVRPGAKIFDGLLALDKGLLDKISTILKNQNPPVTNLQAASQSFENLGQFVSAVHVSHYLGIPFGQLKTHMQTSGNLGKAIHAPKPDVDAKAEPKNAAKQSAGDVKETESST
jgi:hypothetical protein